MINTSEWPWLVLHWWLFIIGLSVCTFVRFDSVCMFEFSALFALGIVWERVCLLFGRVWRVRCHSQTETGLLTYLLGLCTNEADILTRLLPVVLKNIPRPYKQKYKRTNEVSESEKKWITAQNETHKRRRRRKYFFVLFRERMQSNYILPWLKHWKERGQWERSKLITWHTRANRIEF